MTLATLRNRIQKIIDDTIDSSILNDWINDVYHDIENFRPGSWEWLKGSATATMTSANSYTLSTAFSISDFSKALSVRDTTNNKDYSFNLYENRDQMAADSDYEYTISPDNATLYVYPAKSGATLELHYYKTITELSADSSSPAFPGMFHEMIVYGVAEKYFEKEQLFNEANREGAKYLGLLKNMTAFFDRKTIDEPVRMVNIAENYPIDFVR